MMTAIDYLADAVSADWDAAGRSPETFPTIAARHLSGDLGFDLSTLVDLICRMAALPPQRRLDQAFGQPAVTLHSDGGFEIEALFWHSGTPAIHHHAFGGAFRLLAGRSVHCAYSFVPEDARDCVAVGRLTRKRLDLLQPGEATEIPQGAALIHSVFHVENPSVTLVIRTHQDDAPELTYLPPGLAYDTAARSPALHKKLELLDTLATTGHPLYLAALKGILGSGDLYHDLALLIRLGGHEIDPALYDSAASALRERHADFPGIGTVLSAAAEERRRCRLVARRGALQTAEDRIVLALLLSCDSPAELLDVATGHAGGRDAALDLLSASAGRLVGGDGNRQALVRAAVLTGLEGGAGPDFINVVSNITDSFIGDTEHAALRRFFDTVLSNPLLAPMFDAAGSQKEPVA
jgi:hypothetical protein